MTPQITVDELHSRLNSQGVSAREHFAFKCPVCSTVQSITSLIRAGCPSDKAETQVGFSCEGRWSNVGSYPSDKKKDARTEARRKLRGCDWTLGGLFRIHKLEIIDADGKAQALFEIASPEEAQALECLMTPKPAAGEATSAVA